MNQLYRIGDKVVIYKMGEFRGTRGLEGKDYEIGFRDSFGKEAGDVQIKKEYVTGDKDAKYSVSGSCYVLGAHWNIVNQECWYELLYEDGRGVVVGSGYVSELILTSPADQVLKQSDIEALNRKDMAV